MTATTAIHAGFRSLPLPIAQLSLAAVLKCGQSFRWHTLPLQGKTDGAEGAVGSSSPTHEYRFCLRDRVVCLRQSYDTLFYRSIFPEHLSSPVDENTREAQTLEWIRDYFQLDIDLVKLYDEWSDRDPVFRSFGWRFSGIRMLRQDPWENLISFICSSNNHINRITKMVHSLCSHYSPALLSLPSILTGTEQPQDYHPFPPPSVLAGSDVATTLRSLGFGYRAEFIQRTAKMLVDAHSSSSSREEAPEAGELWLKSLRESSTEEARDHLLKFMGVGRKVADCVLLMSLDKKDVVPVDTHVHQIAIKHYGSRASKGATKMTPKVYEEVNARLVSTWGSFAGWAHSVLFTADLKSFSTYGLPTPSSSSSPLHVDADSRDISLTPRKKRRQPRVATVRIVREMCSFAERSGDEVPTTLAERVKRRRYAVK